MEKIIEKNWKWVLLATIIIFLLIPLNIIVNKDAILQVQNEYIQQAPNENISQIKEFADAYMQSAIQAKLYSTFNILILLVYPVLLSAQLIKKIKTDKPTREDFITQIGFIVVPYIINAIILIIIKYTSGINSYLGLGEILKWMGVSILTGTLLASIANLIGCFAKRQTTHVISVYGFLFLPVLIIFAIQKLFQTIIYGYVGFSEITTNIITEWPGLKVFSLFSYNFTQNMYMANFGIVHTIIYLAIITLLIYATFKVINKQKTNNIISITTIYSFVFLATAILIGAISQVTSIAIATIIALAVSAIIYAICILFLKNKNIKTSVISYCVYSVVIFVFVMVIQNNIFGFETRIPKADEVESAVFGPTNPLNTAPSIIYKEPGNIQYIIDRQNKLVQEQTTVKEQGKTYYKYYIQYTLKNGEKLTRVYEIQAEYEDIYDSEEFINQRYSYILDENLNSELTKMTVLGVYNDKAFGIEVSQDEQLFTEFTNAISKDIVQDKAYKSADDAYGKFGEKDGLNYLTVDLAIGDAISESYMAYATTNENYELVKIIQQMINEENEKISWEK